MPSQRERGLGGCSALTGGRLRSGHSDRRLVRHAGQHLGYVPHSHGRAVARELASDVHEAAEVACQKGRRAALDDVPGLATIAPEMSPYLIANVPPKPQHTSVSSISTSLKPLTLPSSRRGCALTPSSRRPEQASW